LGNIEMNLLLCLTNRKKSHGSRFSVDEDDADKTVILWFCRLLLLVILGTVGIVNAFIAANCCMTIAQITMVQSK